MKEIRQSLMLDSRSKSTIDIDEIRAWAERRGGKPALIRCAGRSGLAVLRIEFEGGKEIPDAISWDKFAEIFDENELEFVYQKDEKVGEKSRAFRFIKKKP